MAASVAATAARAAKKRTAKLPNQLRAGAEKVDRWKNTPIAKHMIGKAVLRPYFLAWRLKMLLTGSLLIDEARLKDLDEVEKELDELSAFGGAGAVHQGRGA